MNVGFYATRIQAQAMREREEIESAYDRYPDATLFWCFVDLIDSANYRLVHGPKDGYVRGETFFSLVGAVLAPCAETRLVKELGDGCFLASPTFRPLFESVILIDQTAQQLAAVAGSAEFPFGVRAGIGFGPGKRLTRRHEDYLGTSIDQVARVASVRAAASLLIHEDAYRPSVDILREYESFLTVGEPQMVPAEASKHIVRPILYRELRVDRGALADFREHFLPWRSLRGVTSAGSPRDFR